MPMLPSGRHVGLSARPLVELLDHARHGDNAAKVMGLKVWNDLYPWLEVLVFLPVGPPGTPPSPRADASLPAPPGLIAVHTGYRLADWQTCAALWSEADRKGMAAFLDGRAREHFALYLEQIRGVQEKLKAATGTTVVQLPAQQEGGDAQRNDAASGSKKSSTGRGAPDRD